ncbi:MAG TPA: cupin domain-containing protein [Chloroflexota bacterium]|jgi:quercetin dioxygenase-like cupin family protein
MKPLIPGTFALVLSVSLAFTRIALATPGDQETEIVGRSSVGPVETGPGAFSVNGDNIQLKLDKATDVVVNHSTMAPGGTSGWHSHPNVVFVTLTEGTLTVYDADDPKCTPYVVHAGEGFVEPIDHPHIVRNESPTDRASWYATHIGVSSGVSTRTDTPSPGNCPF